MCSGIVDFRAGDILENRVTATSRQKHLPIGQQRRRWEESGGVRARKFNKRVGLRIREAEQVEPETEQPRCAKDGSKVHTSWRPGRRTGSPKPAELKTHYSSFRFQANSSNSRIAQFPVS